jgi:hypothetical protein
MKLGKYASDNCAVLFKVYGGETVKMSSVRDWHKRFKERCKNVEDDEDSAHHFL